MSPSSRSPNRNVWPCSRFLQRADKKGEYMPAVALYIVAAMLALGAAPLPYGYYMLLRWVACIAFGWSAFEGIGAKHRVWPWAHAVGAILFNPIAPIRFSKPFWMFADLVAAAVITAYAFSRERGRA